MAQPPAVHTRAVAPDDVGVSLGEQYHADEALWLATTIAALKAGQFHTVDWGSLIEELEALAGRDRRELESRLATLIEHILKRCYVNSPYDYRGWQATILRTQQELRRILKQSPSLRAYLDQVFETAFVDALRLVENNYPETEFPRRWPFDRQKTDILTTEFWQEGNYATND